MTSNKGFFIFKNKEKKTDKQPDYRIVKKQADGTFQPVGACWKKYDKNEQPFFSCIMDDEIDPKPATKVDGAAEEKDIKFEEL